MRFRNLSLLLAAVLLFVGGEAAAQSRSETGRHRPQPVEPVVAAADSLSAPPPRPGWFMGATGGIVAGSDLFQVDVVNGNGVPWVSEEAFTTNQFDAFLEETFEIGLFVGLRLGDWISLRGDIIWADMGVSAAAQETQVVTVYSYDHFSVLTLALGTEFRLVRNESHPYLGVSLALVRLDPGHAVGLGQTNLGGRLSLGYQQALDRDWSFRLEGRVVRTGFSVGEWVPTANLQRQPEVEVAGQPNLTTWSLVLGIQLDI